LYLNNNWLNPELSNLDSLVVTIIDSSTQNPRVQIGYYGWNIGTGTKVTVLWTITTSLNERPTHCEVSIIGNYSGKVVVGMTNHKENTSNPNRSTVQLIQDEKLSLLATLGKQGGLSEGFDDTLLLAIFTSSSYFDSFVKQSTVNYGIVLKPDSENKVRWSLAYSWAREANPLFRKSNWKEILIQTVGIYSDKKNIQQELTVLNKRYAYHVFTLSGRICDVQSYETLFSKQKSQNIFIVRSSDGKNLKTMNLR
ncbi:MAG: DUF4861 family protein, partial [Chitinispirillaceae bacterium]|nr:DUF4861 family protein [Chitinispirillaceae bacterium]